MVVGPRRRINAGVMLWEPNFDTYQQMILEVVSDEHPAHIAGPGPEQDLFHVIGPMHSEVGCNFQLHQMFNAISPAHQGEPESIRYLLKVKAWQTEHIVKLAR